MEHHLLTPEERARAQAHVEYFIELLEHRYGMSAAEAAELLRWAKGQRERSSKLTAAGYVSLLGVVITGIVMALVEGIKTWLKR